MGADDMTTFRSLASMVIPIAGTTIALSKSVQNAARHSIDESDKRRGSRYDLS